MEILVCAEEAAHAESLASFLTGKDNHVTVVASLLELRGVLATRKLFDAAVIKEDLDHDECILFAASLRASARWARVLTIIPEGEPERLDSLTALGWSTFLFTPVTPEKVHEALTGKDHEAPSFTAYDRPSPDELRAVQALHRQSPDNVECQWLLGFYFYKASKFKQAVPLLEKVIAAEDENTQARYYLGHCHFRLGDNDEAVRLWRKVIEDDPDGPEAEKAKTHIERALATRGG